MKKHVKTIKIFRLRRAKQKQAKENIDFKLVRQKNRRPKGGENWGGRVKKVYIENYFKPRRKKGIYIYSGGKKRYIHEIGKIDTKKSYF